MVRVQNRPRPGPRGRHGSKTDVIFWIRNLLLVMVVFQAYRLFSASVATSKGGTHGVDPPSGFEQRLKDSTVSQLSKSKRSPVEGDKKNKKAVQPPPAPAKKYEHVLEDPDIDMIPPDAVKKAKETEPPPKDEKRQKAPEESSPGNMGAPIHHIVLSKRGTGPTNVAYVKDFEMERESPTFRQNDPTAPGASAKEKLDHIATVANELSVAPCVSSKPQLEMHPKCLDSDTPQIVYNPADFPRVWCGHEIGPKSAYSAHERCSSDEALVTHLFANDYPPVNGQGMPSISLQSKKEYSADEDPPVFETVKCDIPCLRDVDLEDRTEVYVQGEPSWTVFQTWADSYRNGNAKLERTAYRRDYYYSTQNFKSSVPLTHYQSDIYSLRNRPPVAFDSTQDKAVYLVSKLCGSPGSKRQKYYNAVTAVYGVDSLGECAHSAEVPEGHTVETREGRVALMKQYKFVLAFDEVRERDTIGEMIWEAFLSGTVPIVLSADNFRDHVPPNSCINANDYSNWDDLAADVVKISKDKKLWESYHAWRTDEEAIAKMEAKYAFSDTAPTCRLCRWAYAKKYGLGWNHFDQVVTPNYLPRTLCTSQSSGGGALVSQPFREEWIGRFEDDHHENGLSKNPEDSEKCHPNSSTAPITGMLDIESFQIHRTVVQHDGVTDIWITKIDRENRDSEIFFRMVFPGMRNTDGAHFVNTHTIVPNLSNGAVASSASIQDEFSKVTVLANFPTAIDSPMEGVLEVRLQMPEEGPLDPSFPRKLRVISEDMHPIHDKMTEFFPSSFGKRMTQDFIDPLEFYYPTL